MNTHKIDSQTMNDTPECPVPSSPTLALTSERQKDLLQVPPYLYGAAAPVTSLQEVAEAKLTLLFLLALISTTDD